MNIAPKEQAVKLHRKWCRKLSRTRDKVREGDKQAAIDCMPQMIGHELALSEIGWRLVPEDYEGSLDTRCGIIPNSEPLSKGEIKFKKSAAIMTKALEAHKKGDHETSTKLSIESEKILFGKSILEEALGKKKPHE